MYNRSKLNLRKVYELCLKKLKIAKKFGGIKYCS